MKLILVKLIFSLFLGIICFSSGYAQEKKCGLQLDIFEYGENGNELEISNATAKLYFFNKKGVKKIDGATKNESLVFTNLNEGIYNAEINEKNYKTSVRRLYLDCGSLSADGFVKKRISLWRGSPKEQIQVIEDTDYNKVSEKIPLNDLALKLQKPDYPPAARAVRATGIVEILIMIDEQGKVISAQALSGHPLLRFAAEEAARKSEFVTTKVKGNPAKVRGIVIFTFSTL